MFLLILSCMFVKKVLAICFYSDLDIFDLVLILECYVSTNKLILVACGHFIFLKGISCSQVVVSDIDR